jgi:hypothetical protein
MSIEFAVVSLPSNGPSTSDYHSNLLLKNIVNCIGRWRKGKVPHPRVVRFRGLEVIH